jgi:predicted dehydrogenase
MTDKKLNTAIIGAGKMGQIHAKVYHQLPQSNFVAVVDTDTKKAKQLAKKYKCHYHRDCLEILDKVDAVTISTPTISHKDIATHFIQRGIGVLIEKPLALNPEEAEEIVSVAEENNTVVAVGHSERCNPVVQAMKRLDIEARFIEAHRISPYPFRSTDVGVVMDVMIHDIDIILSLAGSNLKRVEAVGIGDR